jgi:DNA-binding LytR/AlgR family response regulator
VQIGRIRELYAEAHGDYSAVLRSGTRLRVSRRYREDALRRLGVQW